MNTQRAEHWHGQQGIAADPTPVQSLLPFAIPMTPDDVQQHKAYMLHRDLCGLGVILMLSVAYGVVCCLFYIV